jgi:branched-chain amino acid transport system permease protein
MHSSAPISVPRYAPQSITGAWRRLAIQLLGLSPSFAVLYLVLFLIVVAVGGLGSLKGTLVAALVLGVFDTGGKYLFSDAGGFFVYAVTVAVLLVKPAGFYGRE